MTGWTTSDLKYLMFKDKDPVDINAPTMSAYFANFAYDINFLQSFLLTTILCGLDLAVIALSWGPFTKFYDRKVALNEYEASFNDGTKKSGPKRSIDPDTIRSIDN